MNSILMIFMFMIGCEVPVGILSYQYAHLYSSKEVYVPDCRGLEEEGAISVLSKLNLVFMLYFSHLVVRFLSIIRMIRLYFFNIFQFRMFNTICVN